MQLEEMSAFFAQRVGDYDTHMLNEVEGCREGYQILAALLPEGIENLLDLGCGTGLELEPVFARFPALQVTGIDLSESMLSKLREKYAERSISLICASYLNYSFEDCAYDAAISFQTLHHLDYAEKTRVYSALFNAIKPGGVYIECDYMVLTQREEDELAAENKRLRREQNIPSDALCHFDTPRCVANQLGALHEAGFQAGGVVWREGNTTIIKAVKHI